MNEWIYCHKCYAPDGAKVGLPGDGQTVMVSYITRDGNKHVGMAEYAEESVLVTKTDSDIMPDEGLWFHSRSFTIFDDDECAAVPFDEKHVYYEQHRHCRCFEYIGYAWKPVDSPAPTGLNGFPIY